MARPFVTEQQQKALLEIIQTSLRKLSENVRNKDNNALWKDWKIPRRRNVPLKRNETCREVEVDCISQNSI